MKDADFRKLSDSEKLKAIRKAIKSLAKQMDAVKRAVDSAAGEVQVLRRQVKGRTTLG